MPKAHRNPRRPREVISDLAKQTRSRVHFTPELLQGFAEMLKSGRLDTVDRLSISDDMQFSTARRLVTRADIPKRCAALKIDRREFMRTRMRGLEIITAVLVRLRVPVT